MKTIVILGAGESGYGSAVLAWVKGYTVFVSDSGRINSQYRDALLKRGIPFEEGGHSEHVVLAGDEVIKSPGIPDNADIVLKLRAAGIPVISEIEFAGRYTNAKTICITGSNGKTTTTTLLYKILTDAGYNVGMAGNIGDSFAHQVATVKRDWYVLELSSFQLDGMFDFRADIAVLLNITPDHLDRYDYIMKKYAESKIRITQNQKQGDYFIYSDDDPMVADTIKDTGLMTCLPFSAKHRLESNGAWMNLSEDGSSFTASLGDKKVSMNISDLKIKGIHNIYNSMAASLAALAAGIEPESICYTLKEFTGVEHRLEPVFQVNGVSYINDSKATNVDSVWYALESMTRPVIWIAGGTDKGNDYGSLRELARNKVKVLICMGVDNRKIREFFKDEVPVIYETQSMEAALEVASREAVAGDAVLLSPACASFDLFRNYEDRGKQFKDMVKKLYKKSREEAV